MANINSYTVSSLKVNDKILASDGETGKTKNVSPESIAELNANMKVYRAFLTQSGTDAPTANVIGLNTVGNIVWSRIGLGSYLGTLEGAFVEDVAVIICPNGTTTFQYSKTNNYISLLVYDDGGQDDGFLTNQFIEIRVYES
jgi:hypothetical protein